MNARKSYAKISDIKVQELCTMTVDEYIKKHHYNYKVQKVSPHVSNSQIKDIIQKNNLPKDEASNIKREINAIAKFGIPVEAVKK